MAASKLASIVSLVLPYTCCFLELFSNSESTFCYFERSLLGPRTRHLKMSGKRAKTDSQRRSIERDYTTTNWLKKGLPKLQELQSKRTPLKGDEKFLKSFLEELAEQQTRDKAKSREFVKERSTKKREAAAVRRSAGPQLASADSYKRKVHLRISNALTIVLQFLSAFLFSLTILSAGSF